MTGLTTFQLVAAAVHFVPALVWAIVAQNAWSFLRTRRPQSRFFRLLPIVGAAVAFGYATFTVIAVLPPELHQHPPTGIVVLFALNELSNFTIVALARHLSRYFPTPEMPPARAVWLAVNYGSSVAMDVLMFAFLGIIQVPIFPPHFAAYPIIRMAYQLVMLGLIVWRIIPIARPGVWAPGGGSWVPRGADVVFLGGALVSLASWLTLALINNRFANQWSWEPTTSGVVLDAIAGVGFAVPLAVRILGEVVRGLLIVGAMLATTAFAYFGAHHLEASFVSPVLRPQFDIAVVLVLVLLLVPGQAWVREAIDQVIFHRSRRRHDQLQAFVHGLSPELGAAECCRQALPEVVRVMQLRGAAIVLSEGDTIVQGTIAFAPVEQLWRGGAPAQTLPTEALVGYELRELPSPLKDALSDSDVVGLVPITSYRRSWGLLLISAGMLGATFSDEDEQALQAFAAQLALVLDGAELLARAVAVERSLAHSEKLAAIGELAARVAHEIRNPVTAARSLAQQLVREPASPLNTEHAELILTELERVERQVAALLRFARREEFHFESIDLSELARATIERFHSQLEARGVALAVDSLAGIVVRADPEKIRQVLINVLENALDALDGTERPQIDLAISSRNGTAAICVSDNGPGVSQDAVGRLFEPFFSLKPSGTGLGLAIAKRTVEAHGGSITVDSASGFGMAVRIKLPLAAAE